MTFPRTPRSILRALLNGGLAAFFLTGSIVNLFPPDSIRQDYARWGYPDWFHHVTAGMEFLTAVLLAFPRTRALGRATGALVMLAALATLLVSAEYGHAVGPSTVLIALMASRHLDGQERAARWEGRAF